MGSLQEAREGGKQHSQVVGNWKKKMRQQAGTTTEGEKEEGRLLPRQTVSNSLPSN